ncbi:MAG: sugar O-acetyltransferase [Fuerstiella sp.]
MTTEKQKMLAGRPYDALDPQLVAERTACRDLLAKLNESSESDIASRQSICQELFGRCDQTLWLQPPFYCDYGSNIRLGQNVYFNFNCVVLDVCDVHIQDNTFLGPAVQIYTGTHPLDHIKRRSEESGKPVRIGSDVWIGGAAVILPGVTIGDRVVIGAGSVVTKDIPDDVVAVGNPCRILRKNERP